MIPPATRLRASFVEALREFHREGLNAELDADWLDDARHFASYVEGREAAIHPETPRPHDRVPETDLWYADGNEYLGTLTIRHWLTDALRIFGGHIGYGVRPSRRRPADTTHASLGLPVAHELGIDPALLTCDATNIASRRVIEASGGIADGPVGPKQRYWVPTRP